MFTVAREWNGDETKKASESSVVELLKEMEWEELLDFWYSDFVGDVGIEIEREWDEGRMGNRNVHHFIKASKFMEIPVLCTRHF